MSNSMQKENVMNNADAYTFICHLMSSSRSCCRMWCCLFTKEVVCSPCGGKKYPAKLGVKYTLGRSERKNMDKDM